MKIIVALGTSWMLDGLQVTLAGILEDRKALGLSGPQVARRILAGWDFQQHRWSRFHSLCLVRVDSAGHSRKESQG